MSKLNKSSNTDLSYAKVEEALRLTRYLHKETDLVVWTTLFNNLAKTHTLFSGSSKDNYIFFQNYFETRVAGALRLIGEEQLEEDKGADVLLRNLLMDRACSFGLPACSDYSKKLLAQFIATPAVNP
jgi:hypothetical protein